MEWIEGFASESLAPGSAKVLREGGHPIAVFRGSDGGLVAVDNRCPHEGYPLGQGTLVEGVITCPYHNYKFDAVTGACGKGEALAVHEVEERDGRVWVRRVEEPLAVQLAARWASFEEGLYELREGQVLRDVVRLLQLGVTPTEVAVRAAVWDAQRGPWGVTHGAITSMELLDWAEGEDTVRALAVPLHAVMFAHVRRPARPTFPPGPGTPAELLQAVETEDLPRAEGILRGLVAGGARRPVLEPLFWRSCAAHFLDFGHPAIYTDGWFDFLERTGWAQADELLVGLLHNLVQATREDVLPGWMRYRDFLGAHLDACEAAAGDVDGPVLIDVTKKASALEGVRDALLAGRPRPVVADALVAAAIERVLCFDVDIDTRNDVQDNWLSVTHIFTFAHAVRRGCTFPGGASLLFQLARMIAHHRVLDGDRPHWQPVAGGPDALLLAIRAKQAELAMGLAAHLQATDPVALTGALKEFVLADPAVAPIWGVHLAKTIRAALRDPNPLAVLAAVRFAASTHHQRTTDQLVHEARRFVEQGLTPRLLAP